MTTALGIISDVVGLYGPLQSFLFPNRKEHVANVRLHIGNLETKDSEDRSLGGDAPGVALFDAIGNYLGSIAGHTRSDIQGTEHIDRGTARDYSIETGIPPEYVSVVAGGNNGICIHSVVVNSQGIEAVWTGDIGKLCGAEWYPQSVAVDSTSHRPACIWIDTNGDDGHIWKGFNIHMPSFGAPSDIQDGPAKEWNTNRDLMCRSEPRFAMYKEITLENKIKVFSNVYTPIDGMDNKTQILDPKSWTSSQAPEIPFERTCKEKEGACLPSGPSTSDNLKEKPESKVRIRNKVKRQAWMVEQLIVSNFDSHSATELCESGTSNGPDFVSTTEGLFCDMSEKQLWPVCSDSAATYCFDLDAQVLRGSPPSLATTASTASPLYSNSTVAGFSNIAGATVPVKAYTGMQTWG